jgi:hypothetical protein
MLGGVLLDTAALAARGTVVRSQRTGTPLLLKGSIPLVSDVYVRSSFESQAFFLQMKRRTPSSSFFCPIMFLD